LDKCWIWIRILLLIFVSFTPLIKFARARERPRHLTCNPVLYRKFIELYLNLFFLYLLTKRISRAPKLLTEVSSCLYGMIGAIVRL
jgi:hypothetical protein